MSERRVRAVFPGTFDPITSGHLDILDRALKVYDEVIVAILINREKKPFFSLDERVEMVREVCRGRDHARVDTFSGLLVEYAVKINASVIVRGLRAISDFEYEFQMALMNRRMNPSIETVFMMPAESYTYLSSRLVREVTHLGGSVTDLVPPSVEQRLRDHVRRGNPGIDSVR
jgi:pantetheine-phosphate adenylyltransferase